MDLVKSRQRVIDHGEVFTPEWIVEAMLDLVKDESERIDSRFLEPACGDGNFLAKVLRRKIEAAKSRFGSSAFEFQHHALLGVGNEHSPRRCSFDEVGGRSRRSACYFRVGLPRKRSFPAAGL